MPLHAACPDCGQSFPLPSDLQAIIARKLACPSCRATFDLAQLASHGENSLEANSWQFIPNSLSKDSAASILPMLSEVDLLEANLSVKATSIPIANEWESQEAAYEEELSAEQVDHPSHSIELPAPPSLPDDPLETDDQPIEIVVEEEEIAIRSTPANLPKVSIPERDLVWLDNNQSQPLKRRKQKSALGTLVSIVGGGVAAVPIAILLMWYLLDKDPLEAGPVVSQFLPDVVPRKFQGKHGDLPRLGQREGPARQADRPVLDSAVPEGEVPERLAPERFAPEFSQDIDRSRMMFDNAVPPAASTAQQEADIRSDVNSSRTRLLRKEDAKSNTEIEGLAESIDSSLPKVSTQLAGLRVLIEQIRETTVADSGLVKELSVQLFGVLCESAAALSESESNMPAAHRTWQSGFSKTAALLRGRVDVLKEVAMEAVRKGPQQIPINVVGESVTGEFFVSQFAISEVQSGPNSDQEVWIGIDRVPAFFKGKTVVVPKSLRLDNEPGSAYLLAGEILKGGQTFKVAIAIPAR